MRVTVQTRHSGTHVSRKDQDVSLEDFSQMVAHYFDRHVSVGRLGCDERQGNSLRVNPTYFHFPLVGVDHGVYDALESCEPTILLQKVGGGSWLYVTWHYEHPTQDDVDNSMFFFRENRDQPFMVFPVSADISVEMGGTLTIPWRRTMLRFPANLPPWPWPLRDVTPYVGIGILNELLYPHDTNPLTMLIRSPSPYKGLSLQIIEQLQWIHAELIAFGPHNDVRQ